MDSFLQDQLCLVYEETRYWPAMLVCKKWRKQMLKRKLQDVKQQQSDLKCQKWFAPRHKRDVGIKRYILEFLLNDKRRATTIPITTRVRKRGRGYRKCASDVRYVFSEQKALCKFEKQSEHIVKLIAKLTAKPTGPLITEIGTTTTEILAVVDHSPRHMTLGNNHVSIFHLMGEPRCIYARPHWTLCNDSHFTFYDDSRFSRVGFLTPILCIAKKDNVFLP